MKNKLMSFADEVYNVVRGIERGQTMSYKQVAEAAGRPGAWRAVGNVLNKNYNLGIPCHRVVRSDGKPGGYNRGAEKKAEILKNEMGQSAAGGRLFFYAFLVVWELHFVLAVMWLVAIL